MSHQPPDFLTPLDTAKYLITWIDEHPPTMCRTQDAVCAHINQRAGLFVCSRQVPQTALGDHSGKSAAFARSLAAMKVKSISDLRQH